MLFSNPSGNPSEENTGTSRFGSNFTSTNYHPIQNSQFQIIRQDRNILINMICMVILWFAASFCYYLISYQLKYIKGDMYTNGLVSGSSELIAYAISGILL